MRKRAHRKKEEEEIEEEELKLYISLVGRTLAERILLVRS